MDDVTGISVAVRRQSLYIQVKRIKIVNCGSKIWRDMVLACCEVAMRTRQ
jgi:hypothetical protein